MDPVTSALTEPMNALARSSQTIGDLTRQVVQLTQNAQNTDAALAAQRADIERLSAELNTRCPGWDNDDTDGSD